ncbi:hypothetical protein RJ640_000319 [Escallonia rubra]|uniref:Gag-pol polyprotein n=1 Tax=Escallonia rubra TaxID=112253 RepID=A0AA88RL26_9ASTE|nr:hypothetical protein RJ640_000319 [Escallonia rubra]
MAPSTSTKYDLEKFDGSNDFSLWRMKMRVVFIQQGLLKALKGKQGLPDTMSDDEKEDINIGRSRSQSKIKKLKCCHYHKEGHYRKDCPEHKGKKKDNFKTNDIVGVVEDNSDGADILLIKKNDGIVRTLTDVAHVPQLRKIMISLDTLDYYGCSYRAASGLTRIIKGALVVVKGLKQNSLYLLQDSIVTGTTAASSPNIDSDTTKL